MVPSGESLHGNCVHAPHPALLSHELLHIQWHLADLNEHDLESACDLYRTWDCRGRHLCLLRCLALIISDPSDRQRLETKNGIRF